VALVVYIDHLHWDCALWFHPIDLECSAMSAFWRHLEEGWLVCQTLLQIYVKPKEIVFNFRFIMIYDDALHSHFYSVIFNFVLSIWLVLFLILFDFCQLMATIFSRLSNWLHTDLNTLIAVESYLCIYLLDSNIKHWIVSV